MLGVVARFLRRCAAVYHAVLGRVAWRCGCVASSRRHFERVLALGGDEFTAYVHLGRIALGEGDYAGYRREMANARASDAERFARLRLPADGIDTRTAGTLFEETGERATWRTVRPGGIPRRQVVRSAELPTEAQEDHLAQHFDLPLMGMEDLGSTTRPRRQRDDFCSSPERERFQSLPPIRREDLGAVDLDDLMRRFGA